MGAFTQAQETFKTSKAEFDDLIEQQKALQKKDYATLAAIAHQRATVTVANMVNNAKIQLNMENGVNPSEAAVGGDISDRDPLQPLMQRSSQSSSPASVRAAAGTPGSTPAPGGNRAGYDGGAPLKIMRNLMNKLGLGAVENTKKNFSGLHAYGYFSPAGKYIALNKGSTNNGRTYPHEFGHFLQELTGLLTTQGMMDGADPNFLGLYPDSAKPFEGMAEFVRVWLNGRKGAVKTYGADTVEDFERRIKPNTRIW